MAAPPPRIPARYFGLLYHALRTQGVDVDRLLKMARIDPMRLERSEEKLSLQEINDWVAAARQLTGRTDLGFEIGRLIKMNSHDVLGYGMISAGSWHEANVLAAKHYHLMNELFALSYRRTASVGEALYTPLTSMPLETLHFAYEALALAHQNQVQLMLGGQVPAYDIYLPMPEPVHLARYWSLKPVRFHFDEDALPGVRVVMGSELLDRPLPMGDPRVFKEIDERCSAIAPRSTLPESNWGAYIEMMLRESEGTLLTLDALAQRLKVSVRTIDRQLKKEGLNFRDLSNRIRFERACDMLRRPEVTISHVSYLLGFSNVANFGRAFKREFGISPTEYQQHPIPPSD
ncbi:MAG TPA: AraC family transcriptional regulator ligand-binding domain-containing protein [Aquabacterium sp.]|nr:AraC family transcriptional regulator ligand-binding domain-containing protein [Aquabacterium sp.]